MTCPARESLVPFALGGENATIARHVAGCSACLADVAQLREAAAAIRSQASLESRIESVECPDEMTIADFVDGRLGAESRPLVIRHLLTCAHCRSVVRATGALLADGAVSAEAHERRPRRAWLLPGAAAAAAMVLLVLWPRDPVGRTPASLREPALTSTVAPMPIAPRASVTLVDHLVWSSVPGAERYRVRLYSTDGSVVWSGETVDTSVALPHHSVALTPRTAYFWQVEAETEFRRSVKSDLVEFRIERSR